jgi:hypothetical protein
MFLSVVTLGRFATRTYAMALYIGTGTPLLTPHLGHEHWLRTTSNRVRHAIPLGHRLFDDPQALNGTGSRIFGYGFAGVVRFSVGHGESDGGSRRAAGVGATVSAPIPHTILRSTAAAEFASHVRSRASSLTLASVGASRSWPVVLTQESRRSQWLSRLHSRVVSAAALNTFRVPARRPSTFASFGVTTGINSAQANMNFWSGSIPAAPPDKTPLTPAGSSLKRITFLLTKCSQRFSSTAGE